MASTAFNRVAKAHRLDLHVPQHGHGCAALMELPSGQTLLYDAGSVRRANGRRTGDFRVSWFSRHHPSRRWCSLTRSRPFQRLAGPFGKILRGTVFVSSLMFEKNNQQSKLCTARSTNIMFPSVRCGGDRLRTARVASWKCSTATFWRPRSDNANSVVLAVDYRGGKSCCPRFGVAGLDDIWPRSRGVATCCWPAPRQPQSNPPVWRCGVRRDGHLQR